MPICSSYWGFIVWNMARHGILILNRKWISWTVLVSCPLSPVFWASWGRVHVLCSGIHTTYACQPPHTGSVQSYEAGPGQQHGSSSDPTGHLNKTRIISFLTQTGVNIARFKVIMSSRSFFLCFGWSSELCTVVPWLITCHALMLIQLYINITMPLCCPEYTP